MKIWQVDSFAERPFTGNPAGVCILNEYPSDAWMQDVAMEMNCAETAFVVPINRSQVHLRWFTPNVEVDLCGHATLAAMKVLLSQGMVDESGCRFATRSGELICTATGGVIQMDFPATPPVEIAASQASAVLQALRIEDSRDIMKSRFDFFVVLDDESLVKALTPDMNAVAQLDARGVIVTAASETSGVDFVSRFFAPQCDVNEDPVTGSAHCALSPYWSAELGRTSLRGYQASRRGGYVECQLSGDRVRLSGKAQIVIEGELNVTVE